MNRETELNFLVDFLYVSVKQTFPNVFCNIVSLVGCTSYIPYTSRMEKRERYDSDTRDAVASAAKDISAMISGTMRFSLKFTVV